MTAATLSHGSSVGGERAGEETVSYNEAVIRLFVIATMFWGVIGFTAGIFIALELAFPALNLGLEWTSFGRLRPLHTSAVVFAFGGNALFATSLYVVQRTCRATLWGGPLVANFLFWRLPDIHRAGGLGLCPGHHPGQGIRRAGMVRRPVADGRLGGLSADLRRHDHAAPRAAYLCGQLVLPGDDRDHRDAAPGQQPQRPGVLLRHRPATRTSPASRVLWSSGGTVTTRWASS